MKVSTASNAIEDFTTTKLTLTTSYPANITTSWVTHTVNLSEYVGQKIYIAFYIIDYNGSRLMIDEINGPNTSPILCGKPESISVQIDSSNPAATVTWSDTTASNWILEYSEQPNFANATAVSVTDTTYLISGLMYGKQYYVRVKADCLAEDYSDYITTSFITTCGAVNPIAYSETFDLHPTDNDKPICWTRSASFSTNGRNSYPNVSVGTSQDNVGGSLNMHATPNYPMSMIASPEFANSLDNSELTLYARYNISLNSTTDFGEAYLGVMSDPNDSNTFIPLYDLITDVRHQWVKHTISLIGVPATHRHIAFRMRSISGYPDMYIDNINVYQAPTCVMPSNVRFVSKSYDTVMVAWHNNNNTANFIVEYSRNSDFSESSTLNVTDTTVVIRGLEPDTEYFVRVQADCGNGDESFWTDVKSFYTDCSDFDPQNWTESFASHTRDKNKPDCWNRTALYEGYYDTYPYVSS